MLCFFYSFNHSVLASSAETLRTLHSHWNTDFFFLKFQNYFTNWRQGHIKCSFKGVSCSYLLFWGLLHARTHSNNQLMASFMNDTGAHWKHNGKWILLLKLLFVPSAVDRDKNKKFAHLDTDSPVFQTPPCSRDKVKTIRFYPRTQGQSGVSHWLDFLTKWTPCSGNRRWAAGGTWTWTCVRWPDGSSVSGRPDAPWWTVCGCSLSLRRRLAKRREEKLMMKLQRERAAVSLKFRFITV